MTAKAVPRITLALVGGTGLTELAESAEVDPHAARQPRPVGVSLLDFHACWIDETSTPRVK